MNTTRIMQITLINSISHNENVKQSRQLLIEFVQFDFVKIIRDSEDHPITLKPYGPFMIVGFSYIRKCDPRLIKNISNSIICTDFPDSFSLN